MKKKLFSLLFVFSTLSAICHFVLAQQTSVAEQLGESRQQIDDIDRQIVELINKRATVVQKIGRVKRAVGLPIAAPNREQQVLDHVAAVGSSGPFPATRLKAIYSTLLTQMRTWEQ